MHGLDKEKMMGDLQEELNALVAAGGKSVAGMMPYDEAGTVTDARHVINHAAGPRSLRVVPLCGVASINYVVLWSMGLDNAHHASTWGSLDVNLNNIHVDKTTMRLLVPIFSAS